MSNIPHFISNVILSVAFAATFIGIFFFTYAKNVEKDVVVNNVNYTVDSLLSGITVVLNDDVKNILSDQVSQVKLGDMSGADKEVDDNNSKLLIQSAQILGTLFVVSLVSTFIIAKYYDLDFTELIIQNLILLCGIGLTEFVFLKYIIANFISANPNIVKKKVLEMLKH
jgi:hypothetical protein